MSAGARARALAGTVRARTTLGAVAVVGLALVVAASALVVLLRRSLTEDVRVAATARAQSAAARLAAGAAPAAVAHGDDDEFVEVVAAGSVVASSHQSPGGEPLAEVAPGRSTAVDVPFDDDRFIAVAAVASAPDRTYVVVAGRTIDTVVESGATAAALLAVGVPVLVVVVGAVAWRVAGRALAPVEAVRDEVERISSDELHRRVPVPPTGDEIARLAATMNRMLARLESGRRRQARFVSDASHELRSPVAAIRQHAEVALAHPDRTSPEELAGAVLAEDVRLQRLVDDLLLLARGDEGGPAVAPAEVDLDDVVFSEAARIATDGKSVDTSGTSGGRVRGSRHALGRLVANLLDNGVRHARARVRVALFEDAGDVVLRVDDDGPGIPPADRERVFERFVRLDEARDRESGGAGLGLAIVAQVAANHGGRVAVHDSPLGGARLEVRLPRWTEDLQPPLSKRG